MIVDWVEWKLSGGLLVHSHCGQRTVSVRESFRHSWGLPLLWCSTCRFEVTRFEVPEFKWGTPQMLVQRPPIDEDVNRLQEMM